VEGWTAKNSYQKISPSNKKELPLHHHSTKSGTGHDLNNDIMGLDMYFYKKTYVKNWSHFKPEYQTQVVTMTGGEVREDIKPERVSYIIEEIGYWRKFNALHGFIVSNFAEQDDCKPIYLDISNLEEIRKVLGEVLAILEKSKKIPKVENVSSDRVIEEIIYDCKNEIEAIFPPTEGFFFGSQEINNWFKDNVEYSIDVIENALKEYEEHPKVSMDFYYQASW